jgi:hypothetical protein
MPTSTMCVFGSTPTDVTRRLRVALVGMTLAWILSTAALDKDDLTTLTYFIEIPSAFRSAVVAATLRVTV